MMIAIYTMLTLCKLKQCFLWPMFPHLNTVGAQLAYLYIAILYNQRIAPNGSLFTRSENAQKWAHPP